jgi:hypothetical protein
MWIYKVFRILDSTQKTFLCAVSFFIIVTFYKFGEFINWIFWARRLARKENITKRESKDESEFEKELPLFKETAL